MGDAALLNASTVQFCRSVTFTMPPRARKKESNEAESEMMEHETSAATPPHVDATTWLCRVTTSGDSSLPEVAFTKSSVVPQSPYGAVMKSHAGYAVDTSSVQLDATSVEPGYSTPMLKSAAAVPVML